MTQPSTARQSARPTDAGAVPAPRAGSTPTTNACSTTGYATAPEQPTGWTAVRRTLAIVRGLRTLGDVPARPQPGYGEADGQ
ncbi:hypothetical protein ACIGXM_06125 [Kitasatospora sp. NPDC052896]|uniref:hypothetical protein n=1 Tax=Kitasatospora sp. NPDC052896 TaxID=3364061 RepID=UPI0037C9A81E